MKDISNVGLALGNTSPGILGVVTDTVGQNIHCSLQINHTVLVKLFKHSTTGILTLDGSS